MNAARIDTVTGVLFLACALMLATAAAGLSVRTYLLRATTRDGSATGAGRPWVWLAAASATMGCVLGWLMGERAGTITAAWAAGCAGVAVLAAWTVLRLLIEWPYSEVQMRSVPSPESSGNRKEGDPALSKLGRLVAVACVSGATSALVLIMARVLGCSPHSALLAASLAGVIAYLLARALPSKVPPQR